jgi:hypothetical protein
MRDRHEAASIAETLTADSANADLSRRELTFQAALQGYLQSVSPSGGRTSHHPRRRGEPSFDEVTTAACSTLTRERLGSTLGPLPSFQPSTTTRVPTFTRS